MTFSTPQISTSSRRGLLLPEVPESFSYIPAALSAFSSSCGTEGTSPVLWPLLEVDYCFLLLSVRLINRGSSGQASVFSRAWGPDSQHPCPSPAWQPCTCGRSWRFLPCTVVPSWTQGVTPPSSWDRQHLFYHRRQGAGSSWPSGLPQSSCEHLVETSGKELVDVSHAWPSMLF